MTKGQDRRRGYKHRSWKVESLSCRLLFCQIVLISIISINVGVVLLHCSNFALELSLAPICQTRGQRHPYHPFLYVLIRAMRRKMDKVTDIIALASRWLEEAAEIAVAVRRRQSTEVVLMDS